VQPGATRRPREQEHPRSAGTGASLASGLPATAGVLLAGASAACAAANADNGRGAGVTPAPSGQSPLTSYQPAPAGGTLLQVLLPSRTSWVSSCPFPFTS